MRFRPILSEQMRAFAQTPLTGWRQAILAALSAVCFILMFPTFDIEWLAWSAFLPLFWAMRGASATRAFWLGWLSGLLATLGTVYWVVVAMVAYGKMSLWLSLLLLLLMAAYLGLYVGLFALLARWLLLRSPLLFLLGAPAIWTALEYARSFFLFPFPWNYVGYSQYSTLIVAQIADMTGVYGVSFLILLVNAGVYAATLSNTSFRARQTALIAVAAALALTVGYGAFALFSSEHAAAQQSARMLNIAVVQGNIDQSIKWNEEFREHILEKYLRLTRSVAQQKPDMIVWPETAVPFLFRYERAPQQQMIDLARELGIPLLFGGIDVTLTKGRRIEHSLNSAFLLSETGGIIGKYDKIQLVPFGEYVPFAKLLFFVNRLTTAIGETKAGSSYEVMHANDSRFSVVICFESTFPNLVRKFVDRGAQFLVIMTNDAWYGRSSAAAQHFSMAAFRAIENRRAIARAANTGISGFIDPFGRILDQSGIYEDDARVHAIPLRKATTFYTRHGDLFAWFCCAAAIAATVFAKFGRVA